MAVYDRIRLEICYQGQRSEQLFSIRTIVARPYKVSAESIDDDSF